MHLSERGCWLRKQRKKQEKKPKKVAHCRACGIQIGPDCIERIPHRIGRFTICSHCLQEQESNGRIALNEHRGFRDKDGKNVTGICIWLYPDGSIKREVKGRHYE